MKASIIGCNGYIGQHLVKLLTEKKWEVFGYDIQPVPSLAMTAYHPLDLSQKEQVKEINLEVDNIFYFSGLTGTFQAYDGYEAYIDVNEKGLLHLLNSMRESKTQARIIFPSTRLVYKGKKDTPLREDSEKEFKTIYALNKWFGEQVIMQYHNYFNINYNIFRICIPYGNSFSNTYSYGTIGFFLRKAMAGENIVLFGTGEQKRTFTHVEDICMQMYGIINNELSSNTTLNLNGETYSLQEVASKIAQHLNVKVEHIEWPSLDKKLESGDTIFDTSLIQSIGKQVLSKTFDSWLSSIIMDNKR